MTAGPAGEKAIIKLKMKNLKLIFTIAVAIIFNGACHVYNSITVNKDVETDFSEFKTFAWLKDITDTANSPYNNEVIRNNIRNYVGKSFAERAYTLSVDSPDVLLQVAIHNRKMEQEIIFTRFPGPYYYSRYYFGSDFYSPYRHNYYYIRTSAYCYPMGYCTEKIEYMEGSITLNVIDRKKNKLVWTCTAKGNVYDPYYIDRNIHPAVIQIMKKYTAKIICPRKNTDKCIKTTSENISTK